MTTADGELQARSKGKCAICGLDFREGDWIMYGDGDELIHDWCEC
jgi:hypothetical protein